MKTIPVSVDELKVQGITIGRRDTYGTEQVVFDLSELMATYGEGSAVLMVKRPVDETAYPATTEQTESELIWTVSAIDTAYKGRGECEIFWYVDSNLAKTVIFPTSVLRDIGETTEEPPEDYQTWVDSLTSLGAETLENARSAAESAGAAAQSKADSENAASRAEDAAEAAEASGDTVKEVTASTRVTSLDETALGSSRVIEAVGSPVYVDDVSQFAAYGITETGWYVFARITAPSGVTVGADASVTGAAGVIMTAGAAYIDVAVRFDVAAISQEVTVNWGTKTEKFVFKATDLAIRNLDYRVTFYVYDIAPFCTWEYERSTDPLFVGTKYFTEANGVYTQAAVKAYEQVPADTYYTHAYVQAEDEVFQAGVTYYTLAGGIYTPAEVTPGDPLAPEGVDPAPVYYVDQWTLTTDTQFVGTRYFAENDGTYEQIAVKAGEPCSYYIKVITYPLPGTTSFVGTEYWTPDESDLGYARAAVLAGEDIPEGEYFTHTYTKLTAAGKFAEGVRYYKLVDTEYVLQTVTVGASYAKNVYYVDTWTAAGGKFAGTAYYLEQDGQYVQVPVYGGEEIPAAYYTRQVQYTLTEDVVFAAGKTYYTRSGSEYAEAEVTAGDEVPAGTYYEQTISWPKATGLFMDGVTYYTAPAGVYTEAVVVPGEAIPDIEYCVQLISWPQVPDEVFEDNVTYYTLISGEYIEADVTTGEAVPENLVHSKLTIEGMTRNITYQCPTPIDCPVEFILPEIEDETHGAWFEVRFRFTAKYSVTLTVPTGVKVATEHTQAEKAGINMIDLHYTKIDNVKLWRFMNTASTIPA